MQKIMNLRGTKIMIDHDLAELYGVSTKRLKEQVRRNINRFPEDFMFQLTEEEKQEVVAICDHLANLRYSPYLPYAFTEHGAVMLASVLNSERAILVNIQIVRVFTRLRRILLSNKDIRRELEVLKRVTDDRFRIVFETLDQLLSTEERPKRKIGFEVKEKATKYNFKSRR